MYLPANTLGRAIEDETSLGGVAPDFFDGSLSNILERWTPFAEWLDGRLARSLDPYSKITHSRIGPHCKVKMRDGTTVDGLNFASQDYVSLSNHPAILETAKSAIDEYGVHSAGSAALMGNTKNSEALELQLADFLQMADCTVFPTGWGAGYGVIKTLIIPTDHVVIDILAHACLQEGARGATKNVHAYPHLSNVGVRRRLERIRSNFPNAGVLVVTESCFSMDSDVPDLEELQTICHEFGATLLVDVAHDLGAIASGGGGYLEIQGMVGKIDLVMGSFSKTFASNGGFVASNNRALKAALRYNCGPLTFTNALSPVQAATISGALAIVRSSEGALRRARLMENICRLRAGLSASSFVVKGRESGIVPVLLGSNAVSRVMTRNTLARGAIVNLVEYPAVSRNTCRWRLQVMADHTFEDIDRFLQIADCVFAESALPPAE